MREFNVKLKNGNEMTVWGIDRRSALEGTTVSMVDVVSMEEQEEYDEGSQIPEFLDNAAGS